MYNPYSSLLKTAWKYADFPKTIRTRFALSIVMEIAANLVMLLSPYFMGQAMNVIQIGWDDLLHKFFMALFMVFLVRLIFWILHWTVRYFEKTNAYAIKSRMIMRAYLGVAHAPTEWHTHHHSGGTINRINKASDALEGFVRENYMNITTIVGLFGAIGAIVLIHPLIGLVSFVAGTATLASAVYFDQQIRIFYREMLVNSHSLSSRLFDSLSNIITVITLRLQPETSKALDCDLRKNTPLVSKEAAVSETKWFANDMFVAAMKLGLIGLYCAISVSNHETVLVGTVYMIYGYLERIEEAFFAFNNRYSTLVSQNTSIQELDALPDGYTEEYRNEPESVPYWLRIGIRNMNFRYNRLAEEQKETTHEMNIEAFDFERGERIAIIGASGSGKSTFLKALCGLYPLPTASLILDNTDFPIGKLMEMVALIPQESELFENTVGYNIAFDTGKDDGSIAEAMEIARFSSVFKRLPHGLQTLVNEKGVNLSWWEKQRLALARGIFLARESPIILLDEPTSSIDPENEKAIYENIFAHFTGKTVISTVHKPYLLSMFDRVCTMENGRIIKDERISRASA